MTSPLTSPRCSRSLRLVFVIFGFGLLAGLLLAQPPQQPPPSQPPAPDKNAPSLTLDEKIALSTDDIRRQDILQRLQKQFQEEVGPVNAHQEATRQVIEKEHPGWQAVATPQGWQLERKPAEKKAEPGRPAAEKPAAAEKPVAPTKK